MILPNKSLLLKYSILGLGSKILIELNNPQTISSLRDNTKKYEELKPFDKFILTLDFLYMINAIEYKDGIIKKVI
ncbi:hypothetical protein M2325_001274 [Methanococcus voltae PS]|jgi:hypothetical protein|uniref:Uncharacterized protein n=1 Tax=Methanococcus voltae PS TaxID=523842 RepID=A0ABT2EX99_METVO|nr:ABC-three component system middle component 6 [Methanococcus voltae]MCS3922578.1 hypothetical protein [Methanococcus voltae PS]